MHVPERQMAPQWAWTVCGLEVGKCLTCANWYCRCDEPSYALSVVTTGKPATCAVCVATLSASDRRVPTSNEELKALSADWRWVENHYWTVEHPTWRIP